MPKNGFSNTGRILLRRNQQTTKKPKINSAFARRPFIQTCKIAGQRPTNQLLLSLRVRQRVIQNDRGWQADQRCTEFYLIATQT